MADDKKIIIDDDWKQQAQKEKEEAAKKIEKEKEQQQDRQEMPEGNFSSLVSMLATQAFMSLGLIGPEDAKEKPEPDLQLAKYSIDMLSAIEEKTKGNLSDEEKAMLEGALSQLRMAYVNIAKSAE